MTTQDMPYVRMTCRGRRWTGSKLAVVMKPADHEEMWFVSNKSSQRCRAGAIYDVPADLDKGKAQLANAKYVGRDDNAAEWEALDSAAVVTQAAEKREKKETASNAELLRLLLPLRRAYQKTNYAGRLAIEVQVLSLLRRSPALGDLIDD